MCVCVPVLVTTFPEWLSGTEPLPHTPGAVRPSPCHRRRSVTLQSPTATLVPLFSSSGLTGCGYPCLLDRKNRSDMCPRWESKPRLPACKASTRSTRPGSPLYDSTTSVPLNFQVPCLIPLKPVKYTSFTYMNLRIILHPLRFLYSSKINTSMYKKKGS